MKKRILALCLVVTMLWMLPVAAEMSDMSSMLSELFNLQPKSGVIGRWQLLGMTGNDEVSSALSVTMDEGCLATLDIAADTMTLTFVHPYAGVSVTSGAITHKDHTIISGSEVIPYELDGDELRMVKPEGMMFLRRIAPTSPIGHWQLTGIDGNEEGRRIWAEFKGLDVSVELILTDTHMSAILKAGEEERVEVGDITIDDKHINSGLNLPYTVEGDTLTIYSGDIVMTLVRK